MTAIRSFPDAPLVRHTPPSLGVPLQAWARSVWDALHRVGQRRAAEHLLALAERRELTEPALSR
ncbi:MAG TPA: hypothetical protein PLO41_22130, partial [Rubrivivax sp.]|nr:hypothetical protein [Rubrivivax sp.]